MDAARPRWKVDRQASSVVSSLLLLSMPGPKVMVILAGAFSHMRPGGSFRQFTNGPQCPISAEVLDRPGLRARSAGWVLGNVPPAQVFHVTRRKDALWTARPSKWERSS